MNPLKKISALGARFAALGIGKRLGIAFAIVLVLAAIVGATSVTALTTVRNASHALSRTWMPLIATTAALRAAALEVRELEVKHSKALDASYMSEYEDKLKEQLPAIDALAAKYADQDLALGEQERALTDAAVKSWGEYLKMHRKVLELGRAGKGEDARDVSDGAAKVALDETLAALDKLSAHAFAQGQAADARAESVFGMARLGLAALLGVALLVGVVLATGITRSLLRQLGGEPDAAAEVARAVARGDLSTRIALRPGDSTSVMAALQDMQASLAQVVASVRTAAEAVATASAEIAQGNSDLSGRTEQQASSLQQTAASMEELGSTVHQNAESARQADQLARTASEVASKGGNVVGQVVGTMKDINDSSKRIAEITTVIDSIAFQTNILALNAAVEAARAGEQGRGFAVVASEVRNLAQRSAQAAKEIKGLIAASVERVQRGTQQVDQAGSTMHEVVQSIQQVTQIMAGISAASEQQSAGVRQVGEAVNQMDQTTQQNASLVEQSAAAAESLKQQAQELVRAVAVFRLAHAA